LKIDFLEIRYFNELKSVNYYLLFFVKIIFLIKLIMSVYNSNIATRQIDAVFDKSNFRSEFRLPSNGVLLSNMRLASWGISNAVNTLPGTGTWCIDSIQLYDGNQLLDQVLQANIVRNFDAFNNTNDENCSVESILGQNGMGLICEGNNAKLPAGEDPNPDDIKVKPFAAQPVGGTRGWLSLKNFLPFLRSSLFVPTTIFKNLRLVVNWKDSAQLKNLVVDSTQNPTTFEESFVIVDQMVNDEAVKQATMSYQGVTYKAIEHDSIYVSPVNPPAASTLEQSNSYLVNGFNNKTVSALRVTQTPLDSTTWRTGDDNDNFGNNGSIATFGTEYQFRVNGSNKLPRNGADKRNQRLALVTDTFGICNLSPGQNFTSIPDMAAQVPYGFGDLDYTALKLDEKVSELVVNMKRTGVAGNARLNQALQLNVFGEVTKAVAMNKDGSYVVSYL